MTKSQILALSVCDDQQAENFFQADEVDVEGQINRLVGDPALVVDLHLQGVATKDRVDGI
jgi:hypothetical protein